MLNLALLLFFLMHETWAFNPLSQTVSLDLRKHFSAELKTNDLFNGQVEIIGEQRNTDSVIILNAWRIDVFAANVSCNNRELGIVNIAHKKLIDDTLRIEFADNITTGEKCVVKIKYAAPFSQLYGLYKSYFPSKYDQGLKTVAVTTNNEPEMSRLWVPCLDSMDTLSNWTINIDHPLSTRLLGMGTVLTRKKNNYFISVLKSTRPWQASKVAFAVIEVKRFKTYSQIAKTNQTLRFWFPRNITFRMKTNDILKISSEFFNSISASFNHVLGCKNIEFVVLQHRSGVSSGCLVIFDQRHDLNVQQLRSSIAKLWLGSEVLYPSTQDAWFTHALAEYVSLTHSNWTEVDRLKLLTDTVHHPRILEEGLEAKYSTSWFSRDLYHNKIRIIFYFTALFQGVFVISMLADILTRPSFDNMVKELLRRFSGRFLTSDRIFFLAREFTARSKWPACYRAFISTQSDFIGLPVVSINRANNTLTITQRNFEMHDRDDIRFRPIFWTSQWTNPLWISVNKSTNFMWLHHDDVSVEMELGGEESVFVDPEIHGLYLVEYSEKDLFSMWNETQDCSRFHRYCIEPTVNGDFCVSIYNQKCRVDFPTIPLLYSGYMHRWDSED